MTPLTSGAQTGRGAHDGRTSQSDGRRGMAAQKATKPSSAAADVVATNRRCGRPKTSWKAPVDRALQRRIGRKPPKSHLLLSLFAATPSGQDPRGNIIKAVLEDSAGSPMGIPRCRYPRGTVSDLNIRLQSLIILECAAHDDTATAARFASAIVAYFAPA